MSSLNAQSLITGQMKNTISSVSGKLPNGQIPFKEGIADLKGILINPITLQNTLKSGTNVPPNFLKDFDPTQDLVSNASIPTINIPEVEITPTEVPIEKPINTEGLTEKQIQEEERKRELRQKRNEIASRIQNTIKDKAGGILSGLQDQANNLIQGAVAGAATGAIANSGLGEIALKIAAFKFFKAQIAESQKRVLNIQKEIEKVKEEGKDVLKDATKSVVQDGKIKAESAQKESSAKSLEAQTDSMVSTYPGHPGPGNKANSSVTQAAKKAREEADGFKANMEQKAKNVGKFLKDALEKIGNLISTILKVVGAILAIISFIKFLKQLMELLMLLLFGKNNSTASSKENSKAASPEEFLAEIGYPGFTEQDFSQAIKDAFDNIANSNIPDKDKFPPDTSLSNLSNTGNTTVNPNNNSTTSFNNSSVNSQVVEEGGQLNLTDPIIIGDTQIGNPLTQSDLDPSSGKDFNNHPLLGDLSEIHPQITNELYNNGTLPPANEPALDPNSFSVDLDKLYDDIIDDLTETNQIEYIEKLYNLDFEMIGYRRYRA